MVQEIKWFFFFFSFLFFLCVKVIVLHNISLLDFLSDVRSEMKLTWGLHICFYMVEEITLLFCWFLYLLLCLISHTMIDVCCVVELPLLFR